MDIGRTVILVFRVLRLPGRGLGSRVGAELLLTVKMIQLQNCPTLRGQEIIATQWESEFQLLTISSMSDAPFSLLYMLPFSHMKLINGNQWDGSFRESRDHMIQMALIYVILAIFYHFLPFLVMECRLGHGPLKSSNPHC